MFVNRFRLRHLKSLDRSIPDGGGPLPEPARKRLLFQGGNGSGKTTILEAVITLWRFFGEWLETGDNASVPKSQLRHYLSTAELAAIELVDVPELPSLWIGVGATYEWQRLRRDAAGSAFAGLVRDGTWHTELPNGDLQTLRHRSLVGAAKLPNIVFFPADRRTIRRPKKARGEIIDMTPFNWAATFDPSVSLDSILLTVKALSPERFEECLRLVNLTLKHKDKRIVGFGPNGRLIVEGGQARFHHPVEELSAGERQMLLLTAFTVAVLREGGILIIDEPDLHIHPAMVTQLLQTLEYVVRERSGQLIVASHSPLVWDWFSRDEERIELSPWQGVPA